MTEKAKLIINSVVLMAVQPIVAGALFISSWGMKRNWIELLGHDPELPLGTTIAFKYGYTIPSVAAISCCVCIIAVLKGNLLVEKWLMLLAIVEIIALALFSVGIIEPSLFITYRMGQE